jgi:hypothetical protein
MIDRRVFLGVDVGVRGGLAVIVIENGVAQLIDARTVDGKGLKGPWESQHVVHMLDPLAMDRFWYPTGTTGGRIAVTDLKEKIRWMRRLRGRVSIRSCG